MIDFFKKLFGSQPSGATAKERLRLVLLSDHLSLAPDVIDALKRDLLEVIARYVEFDEQHAEVTFEHRDREIAMLASVPILGMRERPHVRVAEGPAEPVPDEETAAVAQRLDTFPGDKATPRVRRRRRKKAIVADVGGTSFDGSFGGLPPG